MKKLQLLIVGLMFTTTIFAQMNFPRPSDNPFWTELHGMIWSCSTSGPHGVCSGYYCQCTTPIYYKTDTIINGTIYNRLYSRGICNAVYLGTPQNGCPFTFNYENPETIFAIVRQDTINKIVYIWDYNSEKVLYDFKNIIVGNDYPQTYNNISSDTLVVVSEDSILLNNRYHKKWDLGIRQNGSINSQGFVSIIEGVGSTFGIIATLSLPFENDDEMICFSLENNVIYPDSSFNCDKSVSINNPPKIQELKIFPNPVVDVITIQTDFSPSLKSVISIMTSTGQVIIQKEITKNEMKLNLASLPKGFYILQIKNDNIITIRKIIKQ